MIAKQQITITHDGADYSFAHDTLSAEVILRENAVATARLIANDYESKTFLDKVDIGDNVKVEFQRVGSSFRQVFGGRVNDLNPSLQARELCGIIAYGYGIALANMLVRQEYGSQSANSTLNKIKEVLTDATYGIIPKYVEKVLASAISSGYTINTSKLADLTSDFRWLYFPGKPAIRCIEDAIDLIRAANTPNAGAHWIVKADGTTAYLCLATVGNHENPPADVWPTYWNTTQAASTIVVKEDMVTSSFNKVRSEANYILYYGAFRRPVDGDVWTENNASNWDKASEDGLGVVEDESGAGLFKVGSYSIRGREPTNAKWCQIWYPDTYDLNFNFTKIGTRFSIPQLSFYNYLNTNVYMGGAGPVMPTVHLGTGDPANTDSYNYDLSTAVSNDTTWRHLNLPVGLHHTLKDESRLGWTTTGSPDWADIDYVMFSFSAGAADARFIIDGLCFNGVLTRAAYDSIKIGTQKAKMLLVHDDIPKDDALKASDDSGEIAQFAKAELYRAVVEPIMGQIVIPMQETILPGQLAHIHFARHGSSFRVDKDMRIIEVRHLLNVQQGGLSLLTLTDDLLNSQPVQPADAYSRLMKAVAPGLFQDRVRGSMIAGDIDILQTLLEKDYDTDSV